MTILLALALLQVKHLIVDWIWQTPYELANKGTYGHLGGVQHSFKHALGSAACLAAFVSPISLIGVMALDFAVHYHIDWLKCWVNKSLELAPLNPKFWWATGTDQFLHQITYLALILIFL